MPFEHERLGNFGVVLIKPAIFADNRGFFMESYKESEFKAIGITTKFVQENHSRSARGILRGLHFQVPPQAQAKLVRALHGEIFDVAVDLRPGPTYLQWVGAPLSSENKHSLYIPEWCAHGFCAVSEFAEVLYKTSAEYAPKLESGVLWNDPRVGIQWPIENPILSERDRNWKALEQSSTIGV